MIRSFRDGRTAALFQGQYLRNIDPRIVARARRKLRMVHAAQSLQDLSAVPGNRLEVLRGDRKGQHSIRINDQWRICFICARATRTTWRSQTITTAELGRWVEAQGVDQR